jgi:phosphatidylserine/phosphatidylglycerophosphate/cardiolipin synthase-like enzyme
LRPTTDFADITEVKGGGSVKSGGELFIVDNADEQWKVHRYLHEWCEIARAFDIATGYFEIGALLSLDEQWQKLERIRLLMGDEVSKRTKKAFEEGLDRITEQLDESIEEAKEEDDFLSGVPAIVEAIRSGVIQARVYRKKKFHAKAYITHARMDVVGSAALVGSSNFTYPGLHDNVELNIQLRRDDWIGIYEQRKTNSPLFGREESQRGGKEGQRTD